MPPEPVRREVERTLVAGDWSAVSPDNFRYRFGTESQARGYITETIGFRITDTFLFAILRVRFALLFPTANRKGWDQLAPSTRRNYLASRAAQSEAQAHAMTVEQWYAVAPDLKAFRRKARGRSGGELAGRQETEFAVYVTRRYSVVLSEPEHLAIAESIRAAQERARQMMMGPTFG